MNYIILDLEWDSAYCKPYKRFINQILQIGAVKVNDDLDIIDTFEVTVKSSISKKVTKRFENLTGITTDMMLDGIEFSQAVKMYNKWVGNDIVTLTWSNSDLFAILDNQEYLLPEGVTFKIEKYLDLQKYVQGEMELAGITTIGQISLSDAADLFEINTESLNFHTAKDDCIACAKLLIKCFDKERIRKVTRDTANPEFYKRLKFKPYCISDIRDKDIKKHDLEFECEECKEGLKRISSWKFRNRWFSAVFECPKCKKRVRGRVSFKKSYDNITVHRRITDLKPKTEKNENDLQPLPQSL